MFGSRLHEKVLSPSCFRFVVVVVDPKLTFKHPSNLWHEYAGIQDLGDLGSRDAYHRNKDMKYGCLHIFSKENHVISTFHYDPLAVPSFRYDLLDGAASSAGEAANDNPGALLRGSSLKSKDA